MKKTLSVILSLCLIFSCISFVPGLSTLAAGDNLSDEEISAKNLPVPKDYEVSQIFTFDDTGVSEEGCYYSVASQKIITPTSDGFKNFLPEAISLDGIGFMFWYKSESGATLRIRNKNNAIILEASLSACSEGKWVKYYYYGGDWENITPKSDAPKDIRNYVNVEGDTFKFTIHNWSATTYTYFDEFYTFTPNITPADVYDNDEQAFKFSVARFNTHQKTLADYYDDGSVELTSTYGETVNSSPINITYNADSEQFKKAVDIAKQGSGYLKINVNNISAQNSSDADAYAKITITFGGISKSIIKYSYGANTSDDYLLKVDDIDAPENITTINVKIAGSIKNVDFKFSPITVFNFSEGEIILQAEDLNPKHKKSDGTVEATPLSVDDDKNRTYVYGNQADSWISFDLPELEVGEYEVYASCNTLNTKTKGNISINNLRQNINVMFTDETYTSYRHNKNISLGTLKITKNYSDGASVLKISSIQYSYLNVYIDYFSFKKTETVVEAEPSSNFVIKDYPLMDDYEIKRVLNTFDEYICGYDVRYYENKELAGYVGNGTAYNFNSRGTIGGGGDSNSILSTSNGFDGDAIRFWFKSTSTAWLRFQGSGMPRLTATIPANTDGGWVEIYYSKLKADGDLSAYKSLVLTGGGDSYIDEIHTIWQKEGDVIYSLNGDGTASVTGYNLRLEDITIADTYLGCPVVSIKENAFKGSLTLDSITLPDSVKTIESGAFDGCLNLKSINLENVTEISYNAFLNCEKLTDITITDDISGVSDTAFTGCKSLYINAKNDTQKNYAISNVIDYKYKTSASLVYFCDFNDTENQITVIGYEGTQTDVNIPSLIDNTTVKTVSDSAFKNNTVVTSVKIADSVTQIGNEAFYGCTALETVECTGVLKIGDSAFSGCSSLNSVNLGESVTTIGATAFADVTSLKRISLPESLTSIASDAFKNCYDTVVADVVRDSYAYTYVNTKATAMTQIPDTSSEYKYSLYRYQATVIGYTGAETVLAIPDTIDEYPVVAIGEGAFKNNTSVTFVSFPEKCKSVGKEAFYGCSALSNFDINNVIYLKSKTFAYCTALSDITLTNIVIYESDTFEGCNVNISVIETQFSRTALELTKTWHAGINFGNIFDWSFNRSNPVYFPKEERTYKIPTNITKKRIDFYANEGFDVVRFPITWLGYVDDSNNYTIDAEYLEAIKEIVDNAIANDMYIIINVHHDTLHWLNLSNYSDETIEKFRRIWEQVADYFKDYDEHLIFESLNEARYNSDWDGNTPGLDLHTKFNNLQKVFYNTVRASGGNNPFRYLMFETYGAQAKVAHCRSVWVPSVDEDSHIMMSLHHYDGRAGAGYNNTQYSYGKTYFEDNGIPCVIGETGCQRVNLYDSNKPVSDEAYQNQSDYLVEWTNGVLDAAETYDLKIIFWEDGGSFGMLNHYEVKWDFPAEVETIMSRVYGKECTVTIDGTIVATVNAGEQYTLPESSEVNFVCYSNGTSNYNSGESITVEDNISLTSLSFGSIVMESGASMRLNTASGLRFYTNIDTDKLDVIRAAAKADDNMTVELGTLIGPKDLIGDELLIDDVATKSAVLVSYTSSQYFTESGFKGVVGSLANILDKNASRDFVGRGFVKITLNGVEKVYYAEYAGGSVENNTRNIGYIATCIKSDTYYYETLSSDHKLIIEKYFKLHNDYYCEDEW